MLPFDQMASGLFISTVRRSIPRGHSRPLRGLSLKLSLRSPLTDTG